MRRLGPDPVITISSQCFTGHGLVSEIETGTPRDGRKSKKVHHTFYNISALRWTFKLIQTVFNYKQCVLGCKKALFCHCVLPLMAYRIILHLHPKVASHLQNITLNDEF